MIRFFVGRAALALALMRNIDIESENARYGSSTVSVYYEDTLFSAWHPIVCIVKSVHNREAGKSKNGDNYYYYYYHYYY